MASKIILKKSSVQDKVPQPADIEYGELALNYRDGWLYYKDINNVVKKLNEPPPAGAGSGADADLLDGLDSTEFLRSNASDQYTSGTLSFNNGTTTEFLNTGVGRLTATLTSGVATVTVSDTTGLFAGQILTKISGVGAFGASATILSVDSGTDFTADVNHATSGDIVFSAGVSPFDVVSSVVVTNLNADLLDGRDGGFFYSPDNPPPAVAEQDTLQTVTGRGATSDVATISLTANTDSTTTTSGTLVVTGGVGIGGKLNVAGFTQLSTNNNGAALQVGSGSGLAGIMLVSLESSKVVSISSNGAINLRSDNSTTNGLTIAADGNTTINGELTVSSTLNHKGLVLNTYTNTTPAANKVDELVVFTKSLTITTDWQDTGIEYDDLATGTYIVQLFANDLIAGGTSNNEYYSGIMSWYAGNTSSSVELPTDEITLHRAGASSDAGLYLRTYRTEAGDPTNLKLQIYSNLSNASATNYVFKFRRLI